VLALGPSWVLLGASWESPGHRLVFLEKVWGILEPLWAFCGLVGSPGTYPVVTKTTMPKQPRFNMLLPASGCTLRCDGGCSMHESAAVCMCMGFLHGCGTLHRIHTPHECGVSPCGWQQSPPPPQSQTTRRSGGVCVRCAGVSMCACPAHAAWTHRQQLVARLTTQTPCMGQYASGKVLHTFVSSNGFIEALTLHESRSE
jgi:hypothetical protein